MRDKQMLELSESQQRVMMTMADLIDSLRAEIAVRESKHKDVDSGLNEEYN